MRYPVAFVLPLALASLAGAATDIRSQVFVERPGSTQFSGQLIVRPIQGQAEAASKQARSRIAGMVIKYYADVDEYVIQLPEPLLSGERGEGENALAADLMSSGQYQYVEPNWICSPLDITPNDPMYNQQWHHPVMHSPRGWMLTQGAAAQIVAVTDTGINLTHADLAAHRVPGYDAYANVAEVDGGSVNDEQGHGTHVAGCAAGIGDNAEGICGPNWNSRIMMVRVSIPGTGSAYIDDILEGARWAADHGAKTVSSSYGGVDSSSVQTSGTYIKTRGALYFYAAGNDNRDLSGFDWTDTIVVGASDETDGKAGFSAYGRAVDVFAPGVNILSSTFDGGYGFASGTSMATPVANGVTSLIWSINPNLTPNQVQTILFGSCRDLGDPGNDTYWGWGRVDVFGACAAAMNTLGPRAPYAVADSVYAIGSLSPPSENHDVLANDFDVNPGDTLTIQSVDAQSARGGTLSRSVGTGPGGRDQVTYTPPRQFTGTDSYSYVVTDSTGRTATATVSVSVMLGSNFRIPENPVHRARNVNADYYNTPGLGNLPNFGTLTAVEHDLVPEINFPSTDGPFATSTMADGVSAQFTGYVTVPSTGIYTFYTSSDDGSQLYIGNRLVVDNNGLHGMQERSGTIGLRPGTHAIRVTFFENGGGAGVVASYSGAGLDKQIIPASALSRTVCPADYNGDSFVDFFDYDDFVQCFEGGECPPLRSADFNGDGFADFFDYDDFIAAFEGGC